MPPKRVLADTMACASPLHTVQDRFSDGDLHDMLEFFQQEKAFHTDDGLLPSSSDSEGGKAPGTCEQSGTSSPTASAPRSAPYESGPQVQRCLMPTAPQCGAFLVQASNGGYLLAMPTQPDYFTRQQAAMQQNAGRGALVARSFCRIYVVAVFASREAAHCKYTFRLLITATE